ncbi:C-factor isoform X1 [Epinephelus moara]|uniref:C-factor isoform X1 n=1 Tax=Epinephelus moara TaxID=300413 RepID=UPI00214E712D|nr:C-factor isoform X1 [Epinephelus moara]
MSVKLEGNILVTGTNRGIGLELVRQLAETTGEQAHIYACCRAPEGPRAEALRDLPTQYPGKITIIKLDMSDEDSISAAVQAVSKQIGAGGLNLLINNAAITKPAIPGPLSATRKKDMMEVYETNVVGPFLIGKVFLPLLRRAAEMDSLEKDQDDKMSCIRSAIINISTIISSIEKVPETFSKAQMYPYRASKAALNMLTRCQAEDFKSYNILVTAIHPGWVRTEMGGEEAPMTAKESAESLISLMSSLSNKDCGMLLDWEGVRIPW